MMKTVKHTFNTIGDTGSDVARMIGSETALLARRSAKLAKRVGPRNGLLGLAALAAVIGGSVILVRYLRSRAAEAADDIENEDQNSSRTGGHKRNKQRSADASLSH